MLNGGSSFGASNSQSVTGAFNFKGKELPRWYFPVVVWNVKR